MTPKHCEWSVIKEVLSSKGPNESAKFMPLNILYYIMLWHYGSLHNVMQGICMICYIECFVIKILLNFYDTSHFNLMVLLMG